MNTETLEQRIINIEQRLARIETLLRGSPSQPVAAPVRPAASLPPQAVPRAAAPARPPASTQSGDDSAFITNVLGWGGAVALVLAAMYLISLAIDTGWLTPLRQVAFAALFGMALIAAGFALRNINRQYAGLMPAAGVAVLFLTIYGAHLYHGLIGVDGAGAAVIVVCLLSLWLCREFSSDLYALFSVAGSYSAPFLLSGAAGGITDLIIYFSAWSIVFSVFAVWHRRRLIYLLALYLGLIGFDIVWRTHASEQWEAVLVFQSMQFAIFGIAAVVFSFRNHAPMGTDDAIGHLPALLIFYALQYAVLDQHLPAFAPWAAVASLAFLALLYIVSRVALSRPLPGGEFLLWSYAALVLFHAGYVESVPRQWAPWVAFFLFPGAALFAFRRNEGLGARWPVWIAVCLIFLVNFLRVVFDTDIEAVPGRSFLPIAYAALSYLGYHLVREEKRTGEVRAMLLYMGHICAMAAALHLIDERMLQSAVWGVLAIAALGIALIKKERLLGQSSLFIFDITAAKALLYDLSGAAPLMRIVSLVILGITFYAGGGLYQRLPKADGKS